LDLVCISSRNEGTPVTLIEAMAVGRAVVSTRVGGVADLMIGEGRPHHEGFEVFANGILVPADDPETLAAALDFALSRPELCRTMGAVGQAYVLKRFSRERLLDDIEAMYGRLMEDGKEVECGL
jgi:glycosyltransferase involved in cell wall biosynthesis